MKLRTHVLGAVALAGALGFASTAFAGVYSTNPTPEDRAATERASQDSLARTRAAAASDAAARQRFEAAQAASERDRARYGADRAGYERDRARYNRDVYGRRWDAFYGHTRFRDVTTMTSGQLIGLTVSTRGGDRIGRIRDVDMHGAGRIAIGVGQGNIAWIDADDLRFDPSSRAVVTDLSRDQIGAKAQMRYPRF